MNFHLRRHQATSRKQNGGQYTGSTLALRNGIRYKRNSNGYYHILDHARLNGDTYNIVRGSPTTEFQNGGQWTGSTNFLAVILNFSLKSVSEKAGLCTSEKYVPENVGVAAGILFLSAMCQNL